MRVGPVFFQHNRGMRVLYFCIGDVSYIAGPTHGIPGNLLAVNVFYHPQWRVPFFHRLLVPIGLRLWY